jgi:hypothetical protein
VTTVEAVVASQGRWRRRRWPNWIIGGIVVAVVAAFAASWVWLTYWPPVEAGSASAVIGEAIDCDPVDIGPDETAGCWQVPFRAGAPVGIGFTVHNDAPVSMTIESVRSIGLEGTALAVLRPELLGVDFLFGADAGRPFEPVEVAPNSERAIQLVGTYIDCKTLFENFSPDNAIVVTHASMRVRWLLTETDVNIPLHQVLEQTSPTGCQ